MGRLHLLAIRRFAAFVVAASSIALVVSCGSAHAHTRRHHHHHHHFAHASRHDGATAAAGYATVHTRSGLTATVIASAREKFQGFINAIEDSGARIYDLGCKSSGHMPNSKHHWGGACDFNQKARNVTSGFMYHVGAIARRFGLTDGCVWSNPDCGHVEVPGSNSRNRNRFASR